MSLDVVQGHCEERPLAIAIKHVPYLSRSDSRYGCVYARVPIRDQVCQSVRKSATCAVAVASIRLPVNGHSPTMSADILQDKSVALNGKNDVPVVSQPTTWGGLRVYKIVVLGDGGVGKSGIAIRARSTARGARLRYTCISLKSFFSRHSTVCQS